MESESKGFGDDFDKGHLIMKSEEEEIVGRFESVVIAVWFNF